MAKSHRMLTAALTAGMALSLTGCGFWHNQTTEATVCSKESVSTGDSGHEYRVYTADADTYVISDYTLGGGHRYNSSVFYSRLKTHTRYRMAIRGYRVPFLSIFQNIVSADAIGSDNGACE